MNGFDIKPSIEPHNRYQRAFLKLIEARDAISMLTPAEQERLAYECLGIRSKEEALQVFFRFFQSIR